MSEMEVDDLVQRKPVESFSTTGNLQGFLEQPKRKSYSVVAMNLETVEDVEKVIQHCKQLKREILLSMSKKSCYEKAVEHGHLGTAGEFEDLSKQGCQGTRGPIGTTGARS